MESWRKELYHHGIKGQKWGVRRGPPYPLGSKTSRRVAGSIRPTDSMEKPARKSYETAQNARGKLTMALKIGGLAVIVGAGVYGGCKLGSLSKAKELGEMAIKKALAESELKTAVSELESVKKKLSQTESEVAPFRKTLDAYKKYSELELAKKEPWKSVLPSDDPVRFLMTGAERNTVMALWDTMKNKAVYSETQDGAALIDALKFMIDQYNSKYSAPALKLATDQLGTPFNEEFHLRGPGSSPYSGKIQEILLPGMLDPKTGKAVRKSVVVVK